MKQTHDTMKRVLAATLSVLTVASPIGANVGGFLTGSSVIVANAGDDPMGTPGGFVPSPQTPEVQSTEQNLSFADAKDYLKSVKNGDTTYDKSKLDSAANSIVKVQSQKETIITSLVPLNIAGVDKETITAADVQTTTGYEWNAENGTYLTAELYIASENPLAVNDVQYLFTSKSTAADYSGYDEALKGQFVRFENSTINSNDVNRNAYISPDGYLYTDIHRVETTDTVYTIGGYKRLPATNDTVLTALNHTDGVVDATTGDVSYDTPVNFAGDPEKKTKSAADVLTLTGKTWDATNKTYYDSSDVYDQCGSTEWYRTNSYTSSYNDADTALTDIYNLDAFESVNDVQNQLVVEEPAATEGDKPTLRLPAEGETPTGFIRYSAGWYYYYKELANAADLVNVSSVYYLKASFDDIQEALDIADAFLNEDTGDITYYEDTNAGTAAVAYANGLYTYTFTAPEGTVTVSPRVTTEQRNLSIEKKYIKSVTTVDTAGETTKTTTFRNDITNLPIWTGDTVTIESTAMLDFGYLADPEGLVSATEVEWNRRFGGHAAYVDYDKETGLYKYQFTVFDTDVYINTAKTKLTVPQDATVTSSNEKAEYTKDAEETEDTVNDVWTVDAGLEYTVTATGVAQDESLVPGVEAKTTIEKEKDGNGHETGKKTYASTFTVLYEDVAVTIGEHLHQRKYTVEDGKIYVECTSPEDDLKKAVAAEVTLDFGFDVTPEAGGDPVFQSKKTADGKFIFDGQSAAKVNYSVKDLDVTSGTDKEYYVSENAEDVTIVWSKKQADGTYVDMPVDSITHKSTAPSEAGSYKVAVTFIKTNEHGVPDTGDNSTVTVELSFVIAPTAVNANGLKFEVNGTEYFINEATNSYQVYTAEPTLITPKIYVYNEVNPTGGPNNDGYELVENYETVVEGVPTTARYYATGATSGKYNGKYEIVLTSTDENYATGEGDLTVKWEIMTEPKLNLDATEVYYSGVTTDVLNAIKQNMDTNLSANDYTLRYVTKADAVKMVKALPAYQNADNEQKEQMENHPENYLRDADLFAAGAAGVPTNADSYYVVAKYVYNQEDEYKVAPLTINPMAIKVVATNYKTELTYGEKQSAMTCKIVDVQNNDITSKILGTFVNEPKLYIDDPNCQAVNKFNAETLYSAGDHTIYVSDVDTLGSGNSNYVAAPDAGSAGTFKVNKATVKTTEFNVVKDKEVAQYGNYYTLNPQDVADAYNAAIQEDYPDDDTLPTMKASDVQIVGGTVTGKNVTNRTYTAKVDFVGDFATEDGKTVDLNWSIGSVNPVELVKFTPEYNEELKACTVVARVTRQETNAAIKEWGLVYDNSGKIAAGTENFAQLLMQDFDTKDYKYKRRAISDPKGTELNVIMANSFVDRPVYAMAYVIYEDGTVEYDSAHAMTSNYFDLVYNNLHINQVDSRLYDNPATAAVEQIPVIELNVQREVAKGYEVTDFGYIYNNSGNLTSVEGAQNWLTLDSSDANRKIERVKQPATTTSYTGIIANSKYVDGVKVYAKAFVTVKDKAGTVKTFMTKVEEKTVDGQTVTDGVFQYKVDVE